MGTIKILTAGKSAELILHFLIDKYYDYKRELYDDTKDIGEIIIKTEVKGGLDDISVCDGDIIVIATGLMFLRRELYDKYKGKTHLLNILRSPTGFSAIGEGNLIFPDVSIDGFCKLGSNNVISAGTVITHHCTIGDSNLLGPGCLLSGSVVIGDNCDIGSGVIFEPGVRVADNTKIPSGAVVVGSVSGGLRMRQRRGFGTGEYTIVK
jgi:acetyltransferase-like isoleucine patch superfamily enzyme